MQFTNLDDLLAADLFDTRDLIDLIADLEDAVVNGDQDAQADLDRANALASELRAYAEDFYHGETVISDRYFVEYAQDLADDIGALPADLSWPASCIDWAQAARELQMDYSALEFEGRTWWVR